MCAQFVTSNRVTCPRCGSLNVTPMGENDFWKNDDGACRSDDGVFCFK